jgi:hypothetical protein
VADIFDEVQEDLRAERAKRLLNRYGGLLAGLALLAVLAVAGLQGWRWWQDRAATAAARGLPVRRARRVRAGTDVAAAAGRFAAVAAEAPPGYRTLARLRAAALRAEAGDRDGALAEWDAIARDGAVDAPFRDLAAVLWGTHALDKDDAAAAAVEARVAPLAEGNGPFRASAAEVRALAALKRGETDAARRASRRWPNDGTAPPGVRDRAGGACPGSAALMRRRPLLAPPRRVGGGAAWPARRLASPSPPPSIPSSRARTPLAGERRPVLAAERPLGLDAAGRGGSEPAADRGDPPSGRSRRRRRHAPGHPACGRGLWKAWRSSVGTGSATARLTAPPLVAGGAVYAMDAYGW